MEGPENSYLCGKACGWNTPNLSTGMPGSVNGSNPTSGVESSDASQIYGSHRDIHIIHSPYYYYESHIRLTNKLEFLMLKDLHKKFVLHLLARSLQTGPEYPIDFPLYTSIVFLKEIY
jgi:hypothetical protein